MKVMDYVYALKPVNWIKGSLMVLIGVMNARIGIGWGRVNTNIYFGLPIFFLIAVSGMLVVLALTFSDQDAEKRDRSIKRISISSAILYIAAFGTSVFHTVYYNLNFLNVFLLAFLGIIWFISLYYGKSWEKRSILSNIIISLSFSFGILYGAALNTIFIPVFVYLFFLAAFFLQFSKDIINDCKNVEKRENTDFKSFPITIGTQKALRITLISEILTIVFLILPLFTNIINLRLYMFPMFITITFIGIATLFTLLTKEERTYYRITKIFLRIGMFFVFLILLLASV